MAPADPLYHFVILHLAYNTWQIMGAENREAGRTPAASPVGGREDPRERT